MGASKSIMLANYVQSFVALVGICLAVYSLLIEIYMDANPEYSPMCDVNAYISCSKALQSRWGKGLGLVGPVLGEEHWLNQRNPVYGIIIYSIFLLMGVTSSLTVASIYILLAWIANLTSLYLAFILFTQIKAMCMLCVGTYIVNAALLPLGYWRRRLLRNLFQKKRR